jgi:hypothetical protein
MRVLSLPLIEVFPLKADPEKKAEVTIRQAREGENIERNEMFSRTTRIYDDNVLGEIRLQQEYNQRKLRRKEAWLVIGRVTGVLGDDGEELFKSAEGIDGPSVREAMSEEAFNRAWGKLPPEAAAEISTYVHKINKTWDPNRTGE